MVGHIEHLKLGSGGPARTKFETCSALTRPEAVAQFKWRTEEDSVASENILFSISYMISSQKMLRDLLREFHLPSEGNI